MTFIEASALSDRLQIPLSPAVVFYAGLSLTGEQLLASRLAAEALDRLAKIAGSSDDGAERLMVELTENAFALARAEQQPEVSLAHLLRAAALTATEEIEETLEASGVPLNTILTRVGASPPTVTVSRSSALGEDSPSVYSATVREH